MQPAPPDGHPVPPGVGVLRGGGSCSCCVRIARQSVTPLGLGPGWPPTSLLPFLQQLPQPLHSTSTPLGRHPPRTLGLDHRRRSTQKSGLAVGSRLQSRIAAALAACRGPGDRALGLRLRQVRFSGCLVPTTVLRAWGCPSQQQHSPSHRPLVQYCPHLHSWPALVPWFCFFAVTGVTRWEGAPCDQSTKTWGGGGGGRGFFLQVPCGHNTQQLGASGQGHTQRPALCVVSKGPSGQTAAPGWLRCFGGGRLSPGTSHGALLLCMQGL